MEPLKQREGLLGGLTEGLGHQSRKRTAVGSQRTTGKELGGGECQEDWPWCHPRG